MRVVIEDDDRNKEIYMDKQAEVPSVSKQERTRLFMEQTVQECAVFQLTFQFFSS